MSYQMNFHWYRWVIYVEKVDNHIEISGVKCEKLIVGFSDLTLDEMYNKKKVLKEFKRILKERRGEL